MILSLGFDKGSIARLQAGLGTRAKLIQKAMARGTTKACLIIQKRARERILSPPKSGKVYGSASDKAKAARGVKAAAKRLHQASAPGQSPANDTGALQRSVQVVAAQPDVRCIGQVTVGMEYGEALELGTKDMEPRPFLEVSAKDKQGEIVTAVRTELSGAMP